MDIIKIDKNQRIQHILSNDHVPNPAFTNEFQSESFTLKLNSMQLIEAHLHGFTVEEGGAFLLVDVSIRNNTNETIELYKEDFMLSADNKEPYYPEDYFGVPLQFKEEMNIPALTSIHGKFIFLINFKCKKIDFMYIEYYDKEYWKEYHLRYKII